jgi:hypothetical protein
VIRNNRAGQYNFQTNHIKLHSFGTFLGLVPADSDKLFAAIYLPSNGSGGLVFGDSSDDLILACLDALLGQQEAGQTSLHFQQRNQTAGAISGK